MKELQVFNFQGNDVRITSTDGQEWFIAKDVCDILGYVNSSDALNRHCKGIVKYYPITTAGGIQNVRIINEPDLYRLVLHSKMPGAEEFQTWLYEDALPTIRKTGSYSIPQTDDEIIAIGYGKAIQKIELLENKIKEDSPKVKAYNKFIEKGESLSLKTCAKEIFGSILGRNNMMGILRSENILLIDNEPAQDYMKYFEVKSTKCKDGRFRSQTFVKPSSMIYLEERVLKHLKKIEDSKPLPVRGKLKSQT